MEIKRVSNLEELQGIKTLQQNNLKTVLSEQEKSQEGFVTAVYSLDLLKQMHQDCPSIVCVDGEKKVIGYALATTQKIRSQHPLLENLFATIDRQKFKGNLLKKSNYIIVGQLCVSKEHRRQGIAQKMYSYFKTALSDRYEYCVTDVDIANTNSLKTHLATGFRVFHEFTFGDAAWNLVLWDWNNTQKE
jgi:ribosomal protein S18 acetylase RimI-like enzyme